MKFDFEEVYNSTNKKIFNYIKKRVANKEDAEDLTSIVYEKVYKNIHDFKWQGVNIESWIFTIAKNSIIDYHRKNAKYKDSVRVENLNFTSPSSPKELLISLLDMEDERDLYIAIGSLKEDDQYLLYYKYFEELSNSEIAQRMNLTETNVGTKLYRLRKKLDKIINKNKQNGNN